MTSAVVMNRPILCLDFDGVVHSNVSGWEGPRWIPDPPVPGALRFMLEALEQGFDVVIHSSRARSPGGIWAMRRWLKRSAMATGEVMWDRDQFGHLPGLRDVRFSRWKPPAMVTIDDRGYRFDGFFPDPKAVMGLKAWNQGGASDRKAVAWIIVFKPGVCDDDQPWVTMNERLMREWLDSGRAAVRPLYEA